MGLKRPKRGIRRPILKVENHRFAIRGFAIRKLETGLKKIEERGEPLWRRRCKLRSTGCGAISGEGNEERERGRGDGAKGLLERGARSCGWASQGETCKSTSGLKRAEVIARVSPRRRISTLSSADFTAFSGCLPLYRPELRTKISRSLLSNYIVLGCLPRATKI